MCEFEFGSFLYCVYFWLVICLSAEAVYAHVWPQWQCLSSLPTRLESSTKYPPPPEGILFSKEVSLSFILKKNPWFYFASAFEVGFELSSVPVPESSRFSDIFPSKITIAFGKQRSPCRVGGMHCPDACLYIRTCWQKSESICMHTIVCLMFASMLALLLWPLFSLCSELPIQIQIMKFLIQPAKQMCVLEGIWGKMNRFSCSCCFLQTGQRRGESNYKDLSLEVAWVALTGSLLQGIL